MQTVKDLLNALQSVDPATPVLVCDTRSGVVEEASFGVSEFDEGDEDYGVEDIAEGTPVFKIYLG